MSLLLFDIDGTMMLSGNVVRDVFIDTFREVTQCEPSGGSFSFAGYTDRGIFARFLEGTARQDESAELFDRFSGTYADAIATTFPNAEGPYTLPGIHALVEALGQRANVGLALSTGNLRKTAYIKLARFGLDSFFPVGGFGDEYVERWRVVEAAWTAAREHYGERQDPPWVIGDTLEDIEAARRVGARVLAVATGPSDAADLSHADAVVTNLADTSAICDVLCSS